MNMIFKTISVFLASMIITIGITMAALRHTPTSPRSSTILLANQRDPITTVFILDCKNIPAKTIAQLLKENVDKMTKESAEKALISAISNEENMVAVLNVLLNNEQFFDLLTFEHFKSAYDKAKANDRGIVFLANLGFIAQQTPSKKIKTSLPSIIKKLTK